MAANAQAAAVSLADLEAVAQAAMGLDVNGNPLTGNDESHKALAEAVKRLSAVQTASTSPSPGPSTLSSIKGNGKVDPTKKPATEYSRTTGNYLSLPSRSSQQGSTSNSTGAYQQLQGGGTSQQQFDADGQPIKRFQCHLCERAFARAYNLNTHLATHDPDPAKSKPFPCPYPSCKSDGGRSFSRKHDLQRHVASTHEHEPLPEDEEEIDENGVRVSQLAKLGLSTPGRKFRCEECGRAFVRRDALKRHQCAPISHEHASKNNASKGPASSTSSSASSSQTNLISTKSGPSTPSIGNPNGTPNAIYTNSIPTGLSLYTSTTTPNVNGGGGQRKTNSTNNASKNGSKNKGSATNPSSKTPTADPLNAPFYPTSITYESLTREVQDMAMHLVAQATQYNQAHNETETPSTSVGGEKKVEGNALKGEKA